MKLLRRPFLLLSTATGFAAVSASPSLPADPAAQLLQRHGSIAVSQVGEHVEPGSYRVHVSVRLGRPDTVLPDGTWLYHRRRVADSAATGTLVVRFNAGRVSELRLAAPALAAALPPASAESPLVAIKEHGSGEEPGALRVPPFPRRNSHLPACAIAAPS